MGPRQSWDVPMIPIAWTQAESNINFRVHSLSETTTKNVKKSVTRKLLTCLLVVEKRFQFPTKDIWESTNKKLYANNLRSFLTHFNLEGPSFRDDMNGILRDVIGFPTPTLQSCLIAHACFETAEVSRLRRTQGRLNPSSTWDISCTYNCKGNVLLLYHVFLYNQFLDIRL